MQWSKCSVTDPMHCTLSWFITVRHWWTTSSVWRMSTAVWILGRIASRTSDDDDNADHEWRKCGYYFRTVQLALWFSASGCCMETAAVECSKQKRRIVVVQTWSCSLIHVLSDSYIMKCCGIISAQDIRIQKREKEMVVCTKASILWCHCPTVTVYDSSSRTSEL